MEELRSSQEERRLHRRLQALTDDLRHLRRGEVCLSLVGGLIIILQTYLLARLIHGLVMVEGAGWPDLQGYAWGFLGALLIRGALLFWRERLAQEMALRVKTRLREQLGQALLCLGPAYLKKEQAGELVNTAVEGVEKLDDYFSLYLPKKLHLSLIPPIIAVTVAFIDPLSALVLLLTGPIIPVLMWLIGTWAKERTREQWSAMGLMSAHFLDVLQGLRTLQLFGRVEEQEKSIAGVSDGFRKATMGVLTIAFLSSFFLELSASISTAIVAVQVGVRLIEGHLIFVTGFFVLLLAPEYYLPFRQFGAAHHAGMEGIEAAARIFEILDQTAARNPPGRSHRSFRASIGGPWIVFRDVTLIYPGRNQRALNQINLEIPAGQITALVGPSGAGKSSMIRLLMGFRQPTAGTIEIEGRPLGGMGLKSWRKKVAFIGQAPHFFAGTVRDNLLLAKPEATQREIERALQAAQALDFIGEFPGGLDRELSEGGASLSGGQRQRLAIARAYLKDAPLLVLDEPSSQLDPVTEEGFIRSLHRLCQGRTALIVAHRLNTILEADQIILLNEGQVLARGSHEELYAEEPLYRQMVGPLNRRGLRAAGGGT